MKKPAYDKCTLEQLKELACIATNDLIANEAWERYKEVGGKEFVFLAKLGKTDFIRKDAQSHIVDISEFLKK